jgi:hypothetical protein
VKPIDLNDEDDCRAFGRTLADLLLSSLRSRTLDREYHDLLRTYDESMPVRLALDGLLEGLGAEVIERHPNLGLVVGITSSDSVLLDRIDRDVDPDRRRIMAVVLATMLALYYPADALDDPTLAPRPLTTPEVHQKIQQIISTMRGEARTNGDPEGVALWELVEGRMSLETSTRGRNYKASTVAGEIERMFIRLRKRSLVMEVRFEEDVTAYRPTLQFYSFVTNRLNNHLYREVSQALSRALPDSSASPAATSPAAT